ncbi:MAG TPA: LacI family DNA-binding transcriptional regulator [Thermoanaerobaculia bacterium]|nr:LacI family DNA-binding transcriptional regulator [Thermoanaerobaculia bacterium]
MSTTAPRPVTLKTVAQHVGLSPATVSLVLNESPVADSIPLETKERVIAAARELDYRPNYLARSLRSQRSFSVGVLVPEISEGYAAGVMGGIEEHLLQEGYFYLVGSHRFKSDLLDEYLQLLRDRLVEGYVLVNTPIERSPGLPAVAVSGRRSIEGVTNVVIDHDCAARLALQHLAELGHERIAFFKGHPGSLDTEDRWQAIERAAEALSITIRPELTLQLSSKLDELAFTPEDGYQEGYVYGQRLLATGEELTTLFAFNDVSAIGAMRAFLDAGLRIPEDVSVVGFDDIQSAAFQNPSLTTVRQPLREMGTIAARLLLDRLSGGTCPETVMVAPELVVRGSTGPSPAGQRARPKRRVAR